MEIKPYKNRIGEKHTTNQGYEVEIIEYYGCEKMKVRFNDDRETILKNISYGNLKNGTVINPYHPSVYGVGYLGEGVFKTLNNKGTKNKDYQIWSGILERIYSKKHFEKHPTYKNCLIVEKWKCFQDFAKWFEENYNPETMQGWHLDKDILVKGNKVYSPETCCFVPNEVNNLFKGNSNNKTIPTGIFYRKDRNKYNIRYRNCNKTFKTIEEAFNAYKVEKEQYIKELANKWRGQITEQVYQALINYQVEITD